MKITFHFIGLFAISVAAAQKNRKLIYGGAEVTENRYPYLAALFKRDKKTQVLKFVCTGSLIDPAVVLTAAHCETDDDAGIDVVKLGLHELTMADDKPHETYNITSNQKVMNPYFDPKTFEDDFMLLFLDQPSAFAPVSLNRDPDVPETDGLLTIMGWGMDETGDFSDVPKQTVLKTRSNYDCSLVWATANTFRQLFGLDEIMGTKPIYPEITDDTICADDGDTSSGCPADSGGPLIVKGKDASTDLLVGVHSGGFDLCRLPKNLSYLAAIFPSVNARVSSAIKWIDEELSEANSRRS